MKINEYFLCLEGGVFLCKIDEVLNPSIFKCTVHDTKNRVRTGIKIKSNAVAFKLSHVLADELKHCIAKGQSIKNFIDKNFFTISKMNPELLAKDYIYYSLCIENLVSMERAV
jgi:hypothetical protein